MKFASTINLTMSICAAAAALLGSGCSDEHMDEPAAESQSADACEHMVDGPFEAVSATIDAGEAGPALTETHTRYTIALSADPADPGSRIGYVDVVVDEPGELSVYLDAPVPLSVTAPSGDELAAEASEDSIAECIEVAMSHTYDVTVGTYRVRLGPTDREEASLVLITAGHGHE